MSEKSEKVDVKRRELLKYTIIGAAGIAIGATAGSLLFPRIEIKEIPKELKYEKVKLANINELRVDEPLERNYMNHPVIIVRLGKPALGGVGPNNDVVAFSKLCTHMGGDLSYKGNGRLVCPIHYTQFDISKGGQPVIGHATEYLPQVLLEYDKETGDIYAVGFNALVYGKIDNLR